MKFQISILFISFLINNSLSLLNETYVEELWHSFKKSHRKLYLSEEIESYRYNVFKKNIDLIEKHNIEYATGLHSYTLGINTFADWTFQEFNKKFLGFKPDLNRTSNGMLFKSFLKDDKLPESIDWRKEGLVTDVKNQGQCGSCWSFSTTGAVEGAHAKATGKLVSLSEQQLVDCSADYGNNGCDGGLMDNAFKYIIENGGLTSEDEYPYQGVQGECKFKKEKAIAQIKSFVDIPQDNEQALKEAIATEGPVSVAIDVTEEKFMLYKEGIFIDPTCKNDMDSLNHGVLVVGYGSRDTLNSNADKDGADFWIVKNSWGPSWGENGYIRMARNKKNMCGIATSASYPVV